MADEEFNSSLRITAPLALIIAMQGHELPKQDEVRLIRNQIETERTAILDEKVNRVKEALPAQTARFMELASEKGASGWLSVLPLDDQGFTLNKGEFCDALALRYGQNIANLRSFCPCGERFD